MTVTQRQGRTFVAHLAARDRAAAIAQVMALMDAGMGADDVIALLLGPAQREVGRLWEAGAWTVAQEHVATGITDDVLQAVSLRQSEPADARARVVVACTEGEYHAMPARMLAEVLRSQGYAVTFLGASLPADSLAAILVDARATALALSCSLSPHLVRVGTAIGIAHAQGVPVIIGGAAFGGDGRRARRLGADAWAADAAGAIACIDGWAAAPPRSLNVTAMPPGDELEIVLERRQLIEACVALGVTEYPMIAGDPGLTSRLRRDVASVVDHLAAAVKTSDATVLSDCLRAPARTVAGCGAAGLVEVAGLVRRLLPSRLGHAHRLLDEAAAMAAAPAPASEATAA